MNPSLVGSSVALSSLNLAFQNGGGPGTGPLAELALNALEETGWYNTWIPDTVKDFIHPPRRGDPDETNIALDLAPAWVSGLAGGLSAAQNLTAGIVTATGGLYGDGSGLTGAGSTAFIRQVATASTSETVII